MANSSVTTQQREFLGHPIGLYVLFFTEMWERFSFYGMKVLLIFYLVKYHLFSDSAGNLIVGSYAALVYALPVIGGFLADRYLGFRKAVTFGGILLVLGHIGMAYEGSGATRTASGDVVQDELAIQVLFFSLALITTGVGFLKANISSIVGELYNRGDKRRDSGFTIFYMGINLGSAISTIVCSWLGETYGWGYGFGAAGIGMFLGLLTFVSGQKYFYGKAEPKDPVLLKKKSIIGLSNEATIYLCGVLGIFVVWQMIQNHSVVEGLLMVAGAVSLAYIVWYAAVKSTSIERNRLFALTILIVFSVVFWALFEQSYISMNLFADRVLDRNLEWFGIGEIPPGNFVSLNPIFIIVFAPVFAWLWVKLGKKRMNPNAAVKFGMGILFVGLGFGALVMGANVSGTAKVAMIWMVLAYLLHTWGELCVSPVGLSYVTKLSPGRIVGFMMGVWFLATASAEYVAALLSNMASIETADGESVDLVAAKASYTNLFEFLFYTGTIVGVLLLIVSPFIRKLMHGVDDEKEVVVPEEKH